jgi:hypothetical protein
MIAERAASVRGKDVTTAINIAYYRPILPDYQDHTDIYPNSYVG